MTGPGAGRWDDVVVGAGSAGATLASRLAERTDRRVLLIEAGPDRAEAPGAGPPLGRPVLAGSNWDYLAHLGDPETDRERRYPYPVGKVVGGSSAVNGAIALRGLPTDFDGWARAGNPDWEWSRVLPYFQRLESDPDASESSAGRAGPLPIHRPGPDELHPAAVGFLDACRSLGIPALADLNGEGGAGAGLVPSNARAGVRISTAAAYLAPARARPNLTVWGNRRVHRVLLDGTRAVGIEVHHNGQTIRVPAHRVSLCAGAVNTPTILLRSGLGAAEALAQLGLPPVADLPGVGENLIDHPLVPIWTAARPGICEPGQSWHQVAARLATSGGAPDVNLLLVNNVADIPLPVLSNLLTGRIGICVNTMLLNPASRGTVTLPDAAPATPPVIALRLASAAADVERLMAGVRTAWAVLRSPPFAELLERVLLWTDRMIADDTLLRRSVVRFAMPAWHPAGTARMGPADDPYAVVDQHCRVHTVAGLRVVDASVMPTIPSAPTNLTCIMLAERVAEWMA